jgi:CHAD domain-containing protein
MTRPDVARLTETEFHAIGPYRWLADALGRQRSALEDAVRRLESAERDDEAIHDLRVGTRRIRGLLDAGRDYLPGKPVRRLERGLKKARRRLGPARDAEVGAELLGKLRPTMTPDVQAAAGAMAAQLLAGREALDASGDADVRSLKLPKLVTRLTRVIRDLEDRHWPDAEPPMTLAEFRRRALATLRECWDEVRALPLDPILRHDDTAQHEFRIQGKKLRYTLELFAPLFPRPVERRLALLKSMQDQLGHLHDLAGLAILAGELAPRAREAGFADEAIAFQSLADRLDDERRRGLEGFVTRYQALVHPGFLPSAPPAAARAEPDGSADSTPGAGATDGSDGAPASAEDAAPDPADASPTLRVIDGGREESA